MNKAAEKAHPLFPMVRAVVSLFATWFYFLIFAQFSFLEWMIHSGFEARGRAIMAAMGIAGLASSIGAIFLLRRFQAVALMRFGFAGCILAALVLPLARSLPALELDAALIGLALGLLTVGLASGLTGLCGVHRFGLTVGLGAGSAYFACNLPWIFNASPLVQAWMAAGACGLGLGLNLGRVAFQEQATQPHLPALSMKPLLLVLLTLTLLVWLDSGLFYVIQHTAGFKEHTWAGSLLWVNGLVHLLFAILAGLLLDRGIYRETLVLACLLLCAGALLVRAIHPLASTFYAAGVSLYSTVLVGWPSLLPEGRISRRKRTGILFGVAGWIGSALGIGMVQDLHRIPLLFLILTSVLVLLFWLIQFRHRAEVLLAGVLLLTLGCSAVADNQQAWRLPDPVRGRQVYINEGCINCHSQYVRPDSSDVTLWGPYRDLEELRAQEPPLFGNRRQGPDLLNVGNRRSIDWLRIRLTEPASLDPHSIMPSYQYLFEDLRGEDLVAYLQSLGIQDAAERMAFTSSWKPETNPAPISQARAHRLFYASCAGCHGPFGLGDGPLAERFAVPVRNLTNDPFRFIDPRDTLALARLIKFGQFGTNMPGHETLTDAQLLGLARLVQTMRGLP